MRERIIEALRVAGGPLNSVELAKACGVRLRRDGRPPGKFQDQLAYLANHAKSLGLAVSQAPCGPDDGTWVFAWIPPSAFKAWLPLQALSTAPRQYFDISAGELARDPRANSMPESNNYWVNESYFGIPFLSVWETFSQTFVPNRNPTHG